MTPDPTLTDEELATMGRLWMAAYQDVGTSTLAYKSLVTFPRLIAALRASRAEVDRVAAMADESVQNLADQRDKLEAEVERLKQEVEEWKEAHWAEVGY